MNPIGRGAFVMPDFVGQSKDIISMSQFSPDRSPGPFSPSVYGSSDTTPSEGQLEMFHASKVAADIRSPQTNPINGRGVKPGRYVMEEPGMTYTLIVELINRPHQHPPDHETHLDVALYVDEKSTNDNFVMDSGKMRFTGFCAILKSEDDPLCGEFE